MRIHTYTYYIHLQHLYLNLKWSFCTPEKRWGVAWASNPRVAGPWDTQLHRSDKCTIIGTWILTIQLLGKDHIESTISLICFFCQLPWIQPIWPKCWDPHAIVTPATVGAQSWSIVHMLLHSPSCSPRKRVWVYIANVGNPLHAGEMTRGPIYHCWILLVATVWRWAIWT